MPPSLSNGEQQEELPYPSILTIEETEEGFFLFRYTNEGEIAGDTWHMTLDDAIEQAKFEYGIDANQWTDIPDDVTNIYEYLFPNNK